MDKDKISFGQALMNKVTEILGYSVNADKKLNQLHSENVDLLKRIQGMYKFNIASTIPYLTGRQMSAMQDRGWTMEEIVNISGYSLEEVSVKIAQYNIGKGR